MNGQHFYALTYKAACLDLQGQHADALPLWDRAAASPQVKATTYINRGKCLTKLGRHVEALESFDQSIALKPSPEGYRSKGSCLWIMEKPDEAYGEWQAGLELDPEEVTLHFLVAAYHHSGDRLEEAMAAINRAMEVGQDQGIPVEVLELKDTLTEAIAAKRQGGM
eukprot:NODE_3244_length_797_cov_78.037433_g2708_i0.p2 GENE.NODE_3244_length_797_cov_78.037433_g2708_i0~~NODE_3244_length_797_cov_78.037433_g2708_i0.p2  ORF type:complete len:166 (+),score=39.96 NODE_3244_length_797_cov_78.037433_g2708_i0:163-660(+)